MATPIMVAASINAQVIPGNAGQIRISTFDSAGAALNVSSGYTLKSIKASSAADRNSLFAPIVLTSFFTPTFDATGLTLSFTAAQATSMSALLPTLRSGLAVSLSNDAGVTSSVGATGTLSVNPDSTLIG